VLIARYGYKVLPESWGLPQAANMLQVRASNSFLALLSMLMVSGILAAVGGMLIWHTYLIATAQGTIDFHKNRATAANATKAGHAWKNIHHLGWTRNWQERFDERGRLWPLLWLLPRIKPHQGDGYNFRVDATWVPLASRV
jgi:hypothetical protein